MNPAKSALATPSSFQPTHGIPLQPRALCAFYAAARRRMRMRIHILSKAETGIGMSTKLTKKHEIQAHQKFEPSRDGGENKKPTNSKSNNGMNRVSSEPLPFTSRLCVLRDSIPERFSQSRKASEGLSFKQANFRQGILANFFSQVTLSPSQNCFVQKMCVESA